MDLDELTLSDKIVAGTGMVLIIDLLFLPWHSIDLGITTFARSAVESPNSSWGVLALLLTLAVVAVTLLRALEPETSLPELPVGWDRAVSLAAAVTCVLLLVKLVLEMDALGIGAWLGVLLAAGMAYGAQLGHQGDTASAGARRSSTWRRQGRRPGPAAPTLRNRDRPRNC